MSQAVMYAVPCLCTEASGKGLAGIKTISPFSFGDVVIFVLIFYFYLFVLV